jgi:luciferase family oxidoreductase group 1
MVALSVLDLSPIRAGGDVGQALRNSLDLAQHVEKAGYKRIWVAEHHNMATIASAATSVLIGYIAQGTSTIRVGSGGIMLPNHAPLVIAEQFGTLESLYPHRIDLGLGRAPGTDQITARALRRTLIGGVDRFPDDVLELMHYFEPAQPGQPVKAVPGAGLNHIPIWILGSSLFGAQMAAHFGLPFAFASHFAPEMMHEAIHIYRTTFKPSMRLAQSYLMLGFNVLAAETDEEADYLASSSKRSTINRALGNRAGLQPPVRDFDSTLSDREREILKNARRVVSVGSPATVRAGIEKFVADTGADELILATQTYEHSTRVRSYELVAEEMGLTKEAAAASV